MSGHLRRRGVILVVVIAMLSIISILAVTFTMMARMERGVSANYVDMVRAKLLAQSGVERAVMEVRKAIQGTGIPPLQFSTAEDEGKPWIYGRPASSAPPLAAFYHPEIPLERAIFCSFSTDAAGNLTKIRLDGRTNRKAVPPDIDAGYGNDVFGVSGFQQGTYSQQGDSYSVRIIDDSSMIYINGPDVNATNGNPAIAAFAKNTLLALNNLGAILNREGLLPFTNLGDKISALRVSLQRNFMSTEEIKPIFGGTAQYQEQMYQNVKSFLTANNWVDPSTLAPPSLIHPRANDPNLIYNSNWQRQMSALPDGRGHRFAGKVVVDGPGRQMSCGSDRMVADDAGKYAPHWQTATNTWETPAPAPGTRVGPVRQPRAPVNVNTAPHEVLEALFTGLTANVLQRNISPSSPTSYLGDIVSATVSIADAQTVAAAIVNKRNNLIMTRGYGFATWFDFNSFIDSLGVTKTTRDIIKANANPNSHINAFNPDRAFGTRFGDVDKSSLTQWTTELCFNSNGYFDVESIGRVCGQVLANGAMPVLAEKKITTAVKVYEVYRIGTQKEYVTNQASGSGAFPLSLYPENLADGVPPAEYDGYMELPSVPLPRPNGDRKFSADYTSNFGDDATGPAEHGVSLVNPQAGGSPNAGSQSCLFADGLFCHMTRRYPSYASLSQYGAPFFGGTVDDYVRNARADQKIRMQSGTIDMWVKPTYDAGEFPTQLSASNPDPLAEGTRSFFSMGDGHLGYTYSARMGPSDQSVCDNRIQMFTRAGPSGTYAFAGEATRLCNPWGWAGVIAAGPYPTQDLWYYWGEYHANWIRLPVASGAPESPYSASMTSWNPLSWGAGLGRSPDVMYSGNWHHLRLTWSSDTSWWFVDGQPGGDDPLTGGRAEPAKVSSTWSLFMGSNRFRTNSTNGYPCVGNCTIGGVRIDTQTRNSSFIPPSRFASQGSYTGVIGPRQYLLDNAVIPFNYAGRVANASWTVQMPRFSGMSNVTCGVGVSVGGGPYQAATAAMAPSTPYEFTGRGAPLTGLNVLPGQKVNYQVTLNAGGTTRVGSPIFEDIIISVIPSAPKFLYYSIE